jgi:ATP-dependent DNA helicase DinG
VRVVPVADMSKKAREENPDWAEQIVTMLVRIYARHAGEPMLVHSVSYDITRQIVEGLDRAGMPKVWTYQSPEQRNQAMDDFREQGGVMVAPSMDRGVDFADDSCRVVVVVKVPYPDLSDRQISAQMHDGPGGRSWYQMMTVRTVVQMTGRAMRHMDDSCTSYVLDQSFVSNLWRKSGSLFPQWWTAALDWRFQ